MENFAKVIDQSEKQISSGGDAARSNSNEKGFNQPEKNLLSVKKTLDTLNACHKVIRYAKNKSELYSEVCKTLVHVGGYSMVWIGITQKSTNGAIRSVAQAGDGEMYLSTLRTTLSEARRGPGPAEIAVSTGKPYVVRNVFADPNFLPWRGEAIKQGYESLAAIPLVLEGQTFGSLNIYAGESDAFSPNDIENLVELTESLVYGISALHNRMERSKAEAEVKNNLRNVRKALGAVIQVLESSVEIRDPYTAGHQRRVSDLARAVARGMNLSQDRVDGIRIAGIIHDIGKIYVPAEILSKPSRLSKIEFNLIKTHSQVGFDILKSIEFPWPVANIVLQHHERINGSGYPFHLTHEKILLEARILGVADVVEAMASHRPYRPALGLEDALDEISKHRGSLYDSDVVDACLELFALDEFVFK